MRACDWCGKPVSTKRGRAVCPDCRADKPKGTKGGIPLNEEKHAEAVALYRSGMSMQAVGDKLGLSKQRISQMVHRSGGHGRTNSTPLDFNFVKAIEMRSNGYTDQEIAEALGVHRATVFLRMKAFPRAKKPEETEFRCSRCGQMKPKDEFHWYKRRAGFCKSCHSDYYRERRKDLEYRKRRAQKMLEWRERRKLTENAEKGKL